MSSYGKLIQWLVICIYSIFLPVATRANLTTHILSYWLNNAHFGHGSCRTSSVASSILTTDSPTAFTTYYSSMPLYTPTRHIKLGTYKEEKLIWSVLPLALHNYCTTLIERKVAILMHAEGSSTSLHTYT